MYFRYKCLHWYKFENDEVEHILSCTCTVFVTYWNISILDIWRRDAQVLCLLLTCKTRPNILPDLVPCLVVHFESKHRTCASLCYFSNIDIFQSATQNSTCTRQNTLYFIILELIPMHTLVSEVHVCLKVTLIRKLLSKPG